MSTTESPEGQEKKLAVGLNPYRHNQLTWIAQLRGSSMNTEFLKAIDAHIEAAKRDPELIAKADEVRTAIERDARAKQEALANLFAATTVQSGQPSEGGESQGSRRSRKASAEQPDS
ncbi:hypothetical protein [Nocardia brasiliensis]